MTSWYRCDTLTNWALKALTSGAGHLWVLRSPGGMNVKFCMKYFIYWTADVKSSKLWSSQLWTQFMQLRILKPEKVRTSTGFKPVTSCYRCDTLTNWTMKPLALGASHLWALVSREEWMLKLCMKYFICWTADEKSSICDPRSYESNVCNCVYRSLKKLRLQEGLNPWPRDTGGTL